MPGEPPAGGPPVDPRLLRVASAVRGHLVVSVVCGAALTGLILLQAWLIARVVAGATDGAALTTLAPLVALVAGVAVARAALAYGSESAALASAARAKSQLRMRLVRHLAARPPDPDGPGAGELVTLATRGLDALDDYVARYLPQLVLAVLVPVAVLVVIADGDWLSAVVVAVTLPLIPLFMALVGMHTQARTRRQWRMLARLGGHFLDVVQGLPTLLLFRRATAVAAQVRERPTPTGARRPWRGGTAAASAAPARRRGSARRGARASATAGGPRRGVHPDQRHESGIAAASRRRRRPRASPRRRSDSTDRDEHGEHELREVAGDVVVRHIQARGWRA